MPHTSAHREMQEATQRASDESRTQALNEAYAFIIEFRDSALTRAEIERAFVERFFGEQEGTKE